MSDSISHLLSQAAEEQAAEARVLSTSLAQIRERVTHLSEQVAGLADLQESVRALETEVRQSTTMLADRLNRVSAPEVDVAKLVAESEQRVLAHVDAAVLSLAKALLLGHRPAVDPALAEPLPEPTAPKPAARRTPDPAPEPTSEPASAPTAEVTEAAAPEPDLPEQALRPADARRGRWRQTGG